MAKKAPPRTAKRPGKPSAKPSAKPLAKRPAKPAPTRGPAQRKGKPAPKPAAKSARAAARPAPRKSAAPAKVAQDTSRVNPAQVSTQRTTAPIAHAPAPAPAPAPNPTPAQRTPLPASFVAPPLKTKPKDPAATRAFAIEAARLCHDDHCEHVTLLDVRALSGVADYILIASGTSDRQMRSVLGHIEEAGSATDNPAFKVSSDDRATWLIADFVDLVVHLFEPNTRAHYDLEMLWGDAPRVSWERADQTPRDRAGLGNRTTKAVSEDDAG